MNNYFYCYQFEYFYMKETKINLLVDLFIY